MTTGPLQAACGMVSTCLIVAIAGCDRGAQDNRPFETAEISRGGLTSMVSATGTLSAVSTVEVGTQVSGTIAQVAVDFNDRVVAGDLMAMIDVEGLDAAVRDGEAGILRSRAALQQAVAAVKRAEAELAQAKAQDMEAQSALVRNQVLLDDGLIALEVFEPRETAAATAAAAVELARAQVASSRAGVASATAAVTSAEAFLAQARTNRRHAEIRAPISGIVIQRSVEAGQTVAASFSTPMLFVIAEDLAQMEIHAQVDESDIGLVKVGQEVEFAVAAHPDRRFEGTVQERRLQPQTIQNVVHYTVVVAAGNREGLLLPGMTATVDFVVERLEQALLVPSAALRFEPPFNLRTAARAAQRTAQELALGDDVPEDGAETQGFSADVAELWIPTDEGGIRPLLIRVLATDGKSVAIEAWDGADDPVESGTEVLVRMTDTGWNPFG